MDVSKLPSGAEKARWLAELALTVDQAQRAARSLEITQLHGAEAKALQVRLELIKNEVDDLRRGGWRAPSQELGSKWIKLGTG
jgi:hypothetical protein